MLYRLLAAFAVLFFISNGALATECIDYQSSEIFIADTLSLGEEPYAVAYDLVIDGDIAYVAAYNGLYAVDISNPTDLQILDFLEDYDGLSVAISNGLVCTASQDDDLHFIDATDPTNLTHVKSIFDLDGLQRVTAHGDYFYAGANHQGVYSIDATDQTNPVLASVVDVSERVVNLAAAGEYLYTIGYDSHFCVWKLTDPGNPSLRSKSSNFPSNGWDLKVNGNLVYVLRNTFGTYSQSVLTTINVTDPDHPFREATEYGQGTGYALAMSEGLLFSGNTPTLQVYDTSVPSDPTRIGRFVSGLAAWDLEIHGNHLISLAADNILFSLDVTQPESTLPYAFNSTNGHAQDITFDGFYALVANGNEGLFIRNAASGGAISETDLPGFLHSVTLDGDLAYLAMDSAGLQIADVSSLSSPVLLDDINTSGHAHSVAIYKNESGTYALVADTEYDMASYDATDPDWIRPKGITYFPGLVYDIEVKGDFALVSDSTGLIHVVDVSYFPDQPQIVTSIEVQNTVRNLELDGDVLYASGGRDLSVLDVSDPTSPIILGTYELPRVITDVAVNNGLAYCTQSNWGMEIVDVTNPASIQFVSNFQTLEGPVGIGIREDIVWLCVDAEGLVKMPLQCRASAVDELPLTMSAHLGAAYPNPFNPLTTISYTLPEPSPVTLQVFDLAGRLVYTLVGGEWKAEGTHLVQWNGRNVQDRPAAAGVYLYRLRTEGVDETRRMVLVK